MRRGGPGHERPEYTAIAKCTASPLKDRGIIGLRRWLAAPT
jgi:hypothetical protein